MLGLLFDGVLLGLSVAVPVGPVSLLCVQRSLVTGSRGGIASGLGAATAHGAFALLALLGADAAALSLAEWRATIRLASAAVLIALGLRTAFRRPASDTAASVQSPSAAYLSTMLLALSNPLTILPYLAIAAASIAGGTPAMPGSLWAVPGVMLGATLWYCVLSVCTALLRERLGSVVISKLNAVAGACLVGFGILVGIG
jgi:threonine/homoserine/homoserine lactone efflux protein